MPAACSCFARVHGPEWRVDLWTAVFGKPEAPIVQPFPVEAATFPDGDARFVRLDTKRCTPAQLQQITEGIARQFGLPVAEVAYDAQRQGYPVKVDENVSLSGCPTHAMGAVL